MKRKSSAGDGFNVHHTLALAVKFDVHVLAGKDGTAPGVYHPPYSSTEVKARVEIHLSVYGRFV